MQTRPRFTGVNIADTDDARLLSRAIHASGLSIERFARLIVRDPRNVYRWLNGANPLPQSVRARCHELVDESSNPSRTPEG